MFACSCSVTYPVIYCNKYLVYIGNITSSTILKYILLKSKLEVMKRKKRSIFCDKKEKTKIIFLQSGLCSLKKDKNLDFVLSS